MSADLEFVGAMEQHTIRIKPIVTCASVVPGNGQYNLDLKVRKPEHHSDAHHDSDVGCFGKFIN